MIPDGVLALLNLAGQVLMQEVARLTQRVKELEEQLAAKD